MRSWVAIAFMVAWCGAATAASAGGLDAPVNTARTVRSELVGGFNAEEGCSAALEPVDLDECFLEFRRTYAMLHSDVRAFEAGLDLREWRKADMFRQTAESMPNSPISKDWLRIVRLPMSRARYDFLVQIGDLGLKEQEVFDALELDADFRARWAAAKPH